MSRIRSAGSFVHQQARSRSLALGLLLCAGCMPAPSTTGTSTASTNGAQVATTNHNFATALNVTLSASGSATVGGTITSISDVDVFALGPMSAGDRIVVDVTAQANGLDADAAVFDSGGDMVIENDDRNLSLNQLDPFINFVFRHDSPVYYLGIAASDGADPSMQAGAYKAVVQITRGGQVPPTSGQVVVLNFSGGTIDLPGVQTYTVPLFNTADIAPQYTGMTAAVEQQIVAVVTEAFQGLDLDLRPVPGSSPPANGQYSTIFFGQTNSYALGLSQDVDYYDQNQSDESIVLTGDFTPDYFGRVLTATELGTAIGNVAVHEIGHLLGLNEVVNIHDPMDNTGGPDTLLALQQFQTSPLEDIIFPIGLQDSPLLLLETIGPSTSP